MGSIRDRTLALAGVFQCAHMVQQLATMGIIDQHDFGTCISSTVELSPISTDAVYGNLENLRTGLHSLIMQLGDQNNQRKLDVARYAISLLHLQRKLQKKPAMLAHIASELKRARQQVAHFGVTHNNVIANMAGIYTDTISQIPPKIIVTGESSYLSDLHNADKIRTILLAGIRSAVLWQQLGGTRWQILFKRRQFVREAQRILDEELTTSLN